MATAEQKSQQEATTNLRVALNNAYGFLKGAENTSSFYAVTFEEMVQKQNDRLTGKNLGGRAELDRIAKVRDELTATVNAIKNVPQDVRYDKNETVNTPKENANA